MAWNIKFPQKPATAGACSFKTSALYNTFVKIDPETDTTTAINPTLVNPLPVVLGETYFALDGCDDFILKVEQYDNGGGAECSTCPAPSTAVAANVEHYIYLPKGSSVDIPGFIVDYELVAVPSDLWTGVPETDYALATLTSDSVNKVYVASCRVIDTCCLVPDVTNLDGTLVPGDATYISDKGGNFPI